MSAWTAWLSRAKSPPAGGLQHGGVGSYQITREMIDGHRQSAQAESGAHHGKEERCGGGQQPAMARHSDSGCKPLLGVRVPDDYAFTLKPRAV